MSAIAQPVAAPARRIPLGRMFVSVPFDYLAIGGGLSLITFAVLGATHQIQTSLQSKLAVALLVFFFNATHFAASTVRLYTKPGALVLWPALTMGLPLVALAAVSIGILWPEQLGWHLYALYVTWSPFHYAAQAFGLACMYHYRSGGTLDTFERRLVYLTCMLPFLRAFVSGGPSIGLRWLLPDSVLMNHPSIYLLLYQVSQALALLTFIAPLVVAVRLVRRGGQGMPMISWLIIFTNGIWWVALTAIDAFIWATIFHGIQYLAIVSIFHAKDQASLPENRRSALYHVAWFYGACLVLGYLIFYIWPYAYVAAGFGLAESLLTVTAVINIHHFIVDRYIWKLRRDPNYQVVVSQAGAVRA